MPLDGAPLGHSLQPVHALCVAVHDGAGLSTAEIGYVTSISLVTQMISSVLSGPLADKLGRRLCTFIVDTIAWTIPAILWVFAQNYAWFIIAALITDCGADHEQLGAPPDRGLHDELVVRLLLADPADGPARRVLRAAFKAGGGYLRPGADDAGAVRVRRRLDDAQVRHPVPRGHRDRDGPKAHGGDEASVRLASGSGPVGRVPPDGP